MCGEDDLGFLNFHCFDSPCFVNLKNKKMHIYLKGTIPHKSQISGKKSINYIQQLFKLSLSIKQQFLNLTAL